MPVEFASAVAGPSRMCGLGGAKFRMKLNKPQVVNAFGPGKLEPAEALKQLKACRPLAVRLESLGVNVELSKPEQERLRLLKALDTADYTERQWSYLRMASGLNVSQLAALNRYLARLSL